MRFLNQKLGKRVNRKLDLLKAKLQAHHGKPVQAARRKEARRPAAGRSKKG